MNVAVVGTGYVGLVTGACFAERGNDVTCIDIDEEKVARLNAGDVPIFEPGLEEIVTRNTDEKRLHFTTDLAKTAGAAAIFLALPTPPGEDGSADLSYVEGVATKLGPLLTDYAVIVNKSTVPVGTAARVRERVAAGAKVPFDVVSNPEFLREGQAVKDFLHPDRIVVGTDSERAERVMRQLYRPFLTRTPEKLIVTDPASAELIKYGANAMLAARISFMNEIARLCTAVGANIDAVRLGMGTDGRIGPHFLYAGPGFGGSCFPKDTLALAHIGLTHGVQMRLVEATVEANEEQKRVIPQEIAKHYGEDLTGKKFALWGLAFKDNTDDIRESPALVIAEELTRRGAEVVAYDPEAMDNVRRVMGDNQQLSFAEGNYEALEGADALVIATNWSEFASVDFDRIRQSLREPVIFDGRNMYGLDEMKEAGFHYVSVGRPVVKP